jgi:two-component system NarL family sensor kinase
VDERNVVVTKSVVQFVLAGLAAVVLISAGTIYVVRRNATTEAISQAREVAGIDGHALAEPNLVDGLVDGDPGARAKIDAVVRQRILSERVVRVKVWTSTGHIVYSDEPRLVGRTFELGAGERSALRSGKVAADLSNLNEPENRFERPYHKLLEVYVPVHTAGGRPLLFEVYLRFSSIAESGQRIWSTFAPVLVAGLLLLYLVQVPMAWSMARSLQQGQQERERLLQRAIDASDAERRRIARDLHDGVVQSLAGVSYSLAAAADRLADNGKGNGEVEVAAELRQAAADTRQSMRDLRSLIVEIAPPDLHEEGLGNALGDLLAPLAGSGVQTRLEVDERLALAPETQALLYRVAQEALRNATSHAGAGQVSLSLAATNGEVRIVVQDDGRGFSPEELERRRQGGHVGLKLLTGLVADAGGRLRVVSTPGEGTRVVAEVPNP